MLVVAAHLGLQLKWVASYSACPSRLSLPSLHDSSQVRMLFLSVKASGCFEDVFFSQGLLRS